MDKFRKIARFEAWINPVFDEIILRNQGFNLDVIDLSDDEDINWSKLKNVDVLHIRPTLDEVPPQWQVNDALLDKCPQLLCVSSTGAGYDTINVDACTRAGVAVISQMGVNANSVAEMAMGLMLCVSRRIAESDRQLRQNRGFSREDLMGHDLKGKTLGIVGIGHAGTATAKLAKAFGMNVIAYDPLLTAAEINLRGAEAKEWDELITQSNIISVHCPRNESTRNMFNTDAFSSMRKGTIFITTARGGIHDEDALHKALISGHLGGAGLDVWEEEPPALNNPLLSLPNVVATYHTAGVSHEGRYNVAAEGAMQICKIMNGEKPLRLVNPEVWPTFLKRYQKAFCE